MIIVEEIVGNAADDPDLARLYEEWGRDGGVERLRVGVWEAQKSRLRRKSDQGTELGINLDRGAMLRHQDVLWCDREARRMVIVELERRHVLIIDVLPQDSPEETTRVAIKLGHILGNQHWPVKIDGLSVYVPVVIEQKVMETVLRTHGLQGVKWRFEEADLSMDLPLVFPSLEDHVHAHGEQHSSHEHTHEADHV